MGFLIAIALLALGSLCAVGTFRRLRRVHAGRAWWLAFGGLAALGIVAGCRLTFGFEYHVSPQMRFACFPLPLAFFHLEDGRWIDYVTPPYVMFPGVIANIVAIVAVALLPLWLASLAFGTARKH
ncbi:MAG: hypothetical protein ACREKL_03865 [Chthoniobacterales bacterium]